MDFEKLKSDNSTLETQLTEKDEQIKAKVLEIQKLILLGGPAQIARAKAELAKLKEMNDVFTVQVDSLNIIAAKLQAENQNLNSNLTQEKSKNENLSAENNRLSSKVNAGSVLKAISIVTEGYRFKGNGSAVVTNKAKQVQKVSTKFVLAENHVIDNGSVDIYLRVLGPDGAVISTNSETFKAENQDLTYNSDTQIDVAWAKGSNFFKGKYNVEIYHSGNLIGRSMIDLK